MAKTRARTGLTPKLISVAVASCFVAGVAFANPTGPRVVNGQASFSQVGNLLQITNSPSAIIHWQSFSIGAAEITRFLQQSTSSAVLNRVITQNPSSILGALQSNGRVFLINPNGIVFGAGAQIDVAGLVASTLNLSNADFLAGRLRFTEVPGAGSVINQGNITAAAGGQVYLVGSSVTNSGIIASPKGEVILAAGNSVELVNPGTPNLRVEISAPDNEARNLGHIVADAGRVGIYAGLINHSGTIRADSAVATEDGRIVLAATKNATLEAGSLTTANGPSGGSVTVQSGNTTLVSGTIEAKGSEAKGGTVQVLGNLVGLIDNASVDASGASGGGTVLVGGDFQGKNPDVQNAFRTYVGSDAMITADAVVSGDGGKVIVWSDDVTRFYGRITARGGANGGNGGFVEISGRNALLYNGSVDVGAPAGGPGGVLFDPRNITIADGGEGFPLALNDEFGENIGGSVTFDADQITAVTNTGAAVTLQANTDIVVNEAIVTNNAGGAGGAFTLQAGRAVAINANITTDDGDLSITANHPGATLADRLAGAGGITMAAGTTLNAGTGKATLTVGSGVAGAAGGDIVVANISATNIELQQNSPTNNNSILRASAASLLSGTNLLLEVDHTGFVSGGSIGTAAAPIRVQVSNLEAHTHEASPGIFISSPTQGLTIGGVGFFGGAVKGVQNVTSGDISITANGDLETRAGFVECGMFGTGGPVCTAGSTITLDAANQIKIQNIVSARGVDGEEGAAGGPASVTLTAGTGIILDGGKIFARGGSGTTGGNAAATLRTTTGDINLLNGSSIKVDGGDGSNNPSGLTTGGKATVTLKADAGGIKINNSFVTANGGAAQNSCSDCSDFAVMARGGDAEVKLTAAGSITVEKNSATVTAKGGLAQNFCSSYCASFSATATGGKATVTLDPVGITVGSEEFGRGFITARGGDAENVCFGSCSNFTVTATGGAAEVKLTASDSITVENFSSINARGGTGRNTCDSGASCDRFTATATGGAAEVKLTASDIIEVKNSSSIDARGGSGWNICGYSANCDDFTATASGGNAIVTLDPVSITVNNSSIDVDGGWARNLCDGDCSDFTATASGGKGEIVMTAGAGGIQILNGSRLEADGAEGGLGRIDLSTTGSILVENSNGIHARGGEFFDFVGPGAGGNASVSLNAGGSITLINSTVGAHGGDGFLGNGGNAFVALTTGGNVALASSVQANGGSGSPDGVGRIDLTFLNSSGTYSVNGVTGAIVDDPAEPTSGFFVNFPQPAQLDVNFFVHMPSAEVPVPDTCALLASAGMCGGGEGSNPLGAPPLEEPGLGAPDDEKKKQLPICGAGTGR